MIAHITGLNGWLATHLAKRLREAGHSVVGSGREHSLHPYTCLREGELPDVVVHAGAKVGREFGELEKDGTVMANAASTAVWASACADLGIPMLYLSTSEIYGDTHGYPAIEDLNPNGWPVNLYGLTKRWGEEVVQLYLPEDRYAIARISMPYGPGMRPGQGRAALINFIWQALHDAPITVHADSARSWCWVGDTVDALAMITIGLVAGLGDEQDEWHEPWGAWNVGSNEQWSMCQVAEMCIEMADSLSNIAVVKAPPGQVLVKRLPTDRLDALGWKPQVDLPHGIAATLAVLREQMGKWPAPVAVPTAPPVP